VIKRLCRQSGVVPDCLEKLFRDGREPSLADLLQVLEAVLQEFETIYVIIDAVDESTPREDLRRIIRDLATDARFQTARVLVTSREYVDIENVMSGISSLISMRNPVLDEDIRTFVTSQLFANRKLKRWPANIQLEALKSLSSKAKGMDVRC